MSTVKLIFLAVIIVVAYVFGYLEGRRKEIKKIIDIIEFIENEESSSRKDS